MWSLVILGMKMGNNPEITFRLDNHTTAETFPLFKSNSFHYHMLVMVSSKDDKKKLTQDILENIDWSKEETRLVINYTIRSQSRYNMEDVFTKRGEL